MSLKKFIVVLDINSDQHKEVLQEEIRTAIEDQVLARQRTTPGHPDGQVYFIGKVQEVRLINH